MSQPLNTTDIQAHLEDPLGQKLTATGFSELKNKSEPLTYVKPMPDKINIVVRVLVNGWTAKDYYLTVFAGINHLDIAKEFMAAAKLAGKSSGSLELCGMFIPNDVNKVGKKNNLRVWKLSDWEDYELLADDITAAATEIVNTQLKKYASLEGLYNAVAHYEDNPAVRMYDNKQLAILMPLTEAALKN